MPAPDFNSLLTNVRSLLGNFNATERPSLDVDTEGVGGGGLVQLILNGQGNVREINIKPLLLEQENVHHLEQLLMGAFNDALEKYREALADKTANSMLQNIPDPEDLSNLVSLMIDNEKK